MSRNTPSPLDVNSGTEARAGIEPSSIPVTADALVAAANLLLVPRSRLRNVALNQGVEVAEVAALATPGRQPALTVLRRICGPVAVCLREALRLDPAHAEAHSLLATVYEHLGRKAAAIEHRRQAMALKPADREERNALARVLLDNGQPEEAMQAMSDSPVLPTEARFRTLHALSFEDWAARQGAPLIALNDRSPLRYSFNVILDGQSIRKTTEIDQRALAVAEVRSLTLMSGSVPVAPDGTYIAGAINDGRAVPIRGVHHLTDTTILADDFGTDQRIDGPCLVMCGFPMHYDNYFHAIGQNLIRLPLILQRPEFSRLPVAVSERIRPWALQFLEAIGVSEERIVYVKQDRSTTIEQAILPSPPTRLGLPSTAEARSLRETLFPSGAPAAPKDRLFITRESLPKLGRLLVNEKAIQGIAADHGFRIIDPGAMSFREQLKTFSHAEVICGSTGAGLTNILYAPEAGRALCFTPREVCFPHYLHLAAVAGQRFNWCLGSFLPEAQASPLYPHLPYVVDEASARALFRTLAE